MVDQKNSDMPIQRSAATCDVYPIIPENTDILSIIPHLPKLVSYECVTVLRLYISQPLLTKTIIEIANFLDQYDVALIIAPAHVDLIQTLPLDCIDGLHLPYIEALKSVPTTYHKKDIFLQIGCSCASLDEAMYAGEQGVDYITFPATETTSISQWSLITQLPCVADCHDDLALAQKSFHAGADFLGITIQFNETDQQNFSTLNTLLSE